MNQLMRLFSLALREGRGSKRRLMLYMSSIILGVAALVSIDSFASNVTRSIDEQSKNLLGGDAQIRARQPFTARTLQIVDSLGGLGIEVTQSVRMASMVSKSDNSETRLSNLTAIEKEFPFYGTIETYPASAFKELQSGKYAAVDSALLRVFNIDIGDSIRIGNSVVTVNGIVLSNNALAGIASSLGPQVYISAATLDNTELMQFGATAEHSILLKTPADILPSKLAEELRPVLEKENARIQTVSQSQRSTERSMSTLTQFIGVIGLLALLLGGVGVASGTSAYIAEKQSTISILRCLGASNVQILMIFLIQIVGLALIAAASGAIIGIVIQLFLPVVAGGLIPATVSFQLDKMAILQGVAIGAWTAGLFALGPILSIRDISPLAVIRSVYEESSSTGSISSMRTYGLKNMIGSWTNLFVGLCIIITAVAISILRAGSVKRGIAMAAGMAVAILCLYVVSILLIKSTAILRKQKLAYTVAQGIANLHRPKNHTKSIILSLGFGAFLLSTLYIIQHNILNSLTVPNTSTSGNLIFFDIQPDQLSSFDSILTGAGAKVIQSTPIITMRISEINGLPVAGFINDTSAPNRWAFRREYRSTYRDSLQDGEKIVQGKWFYSNASKTDQVAAGLNAHEVSLEAGIAKDLGVKVGDSITWDIQGVTVSTKITSLREVSWNRFEPNFFAVFTPVSLNRAPRQFVSVVKTLSETESGNIQALISAKLSNVSSIDISAVRSTIEDILGKVSAAVLGLAIFAFATGIPVIVTAISATRKERISEGILLKTLGASKSQVRSILTTEYTMLGIVGGATGVLLSTIAGWASLKYMFDMSFSLPIGNIAFVFFVAIAIAVCTGLLATRSVYKEPKAS